MRPSTCVPGDGLLHPIPLVALAVLVLNDHWWKHAAPGAVTGKLSDVAGMAFFPLLLQGLWEIARAWARRAWGPSRRALCVAMIATGAVFGLAKTWAPANALVRSAAGVGVTLIAGAAFRPDALSGPYVRIALAQSADVVREGLDRLAALTLPERLTVR